MSIQMCSKLLLSLGQTQQCGDKHHLLDPTSHSKCRHGKHATASKLIVTPHVTRPCPRDHLYHRASDQCSLPPCPCFLDNLPLTLLQKQASPRSLLVGARRPLGMFLCLTAQAPAPAPTAVVMSQILCLSAKDLSLASTRCKWQGPLNIPATLLRVCHLHPLIPLRTVKIHQEFQQPYEMCLLK